MWLNTALVIAIIIVSGLLFFQILKQHIGDARFWCIIALIDGPKFWDEIDIYIENHTVGHKSFHWVILNTALEELLSEEIIRRKEEKHPVTNDDQWKYYFNRTNNSKKEKRNISLLQPTLDEGFVMLVVGT